MMKPSGSIWKHVTKRMGYTLMDRLEFKSKLCLQHKLISILSVKEERKPTLTLTFLNLLVG
jgi:hypothetical protein